MKTFAYGETAQHRCSKQCCAFVSKLSEDLGRMRVVREMYPDLLDRLAAQALVDNVEASTHIEGIYPDAGRVAAIVEGAEPTTDAEHQVAGLAKAQRAVDGRYDEMPVSTTTILAFYESIFGYRGFGKRSHYRKRDTMSMLVDGVPQNVQVSPITAYETPLYLGSACDTLSDVQNASTAQGDGEDSPACEQVISVPQFVVDLLCITPFDEGNGRIVRLFSDLLAIRSGIDIGRYVSINRAFERDGMRYYEALNACTEGWDTNTNTYEPFIEYWMQTVHAAYGQLFDMLEVGEGGAAGKSARVRAFFEHHPGRHAKRDIVQANPDISVSTIENALADLVREGFLRKVGAGRGTAYERCEGEAE